MIKLINDFIKDEDGASTVDMTMLMAAIVSLTLAVMTLMNTGISVQSGEISNFLIAQDVGPAWE